MWRKRENKKLVHLSALCSLFNFQKAHGMVLVMLRLRDVCREGGSPPYLPSSENCRVIAWVDVERDRKQELTISTFLCSFQNRTILTRSLSPTAAILFLFIFCRFPALGRWRESAEEKVWYFPKNLFHFASHCLLLVSMEGALSICSLACSHCTFVPHMIYLKRDKRGGCCTHTHTPHIIRTFTAPH